MTLLFGGTFLTATPQFSCQTAGVLYKKKEIPTNLAMKNPFSYELPSKRYGQKEKSGLLSPGLPYNEICVAELNENSSFPTDFDASLLHHVTVCLRL
jgi:hypothetical protein